MSMKALGSMDSTPLKNPYIRSIEAIANFKNKPKPKPKFLVNWSNRNDQISLPKIQSPRHSVEE